MTFIFELHRFRPAEVGINANRIVFCLCFLTLYAGANSMPQIIGNVGGDAAEAMAKHAFVSGMMSYREAQPEDREEYDRLLNQFTNTNQ